MRRDHGGDIRGAARAAGMRPEEMLDLSASINPFGPPPSVMEALALERWEIVSYPDPEQTALREAASRRYGVDPDKILPVAGSEEAIRWLLAGRRTLVVGPAYSSYERASGSARVVAFGAEDGFLPVGERLRIEAADFGPDMIVIASPSSPAGVTLPEEILLEILDIARSFGASLVLDEAFIDFVPGKGLSRLVPLEGLIVLRSMTKFHALAGLRLGFVLSEAGLLRELSRRLPLWSVSTPAAAAGRIALLDEGWYNRSRLLFAEAAARFDAVIGSLPGISIASGEANFRLLDISGTGISSKTFTERLLPLGVMVRDCSNFASMGERYIRAAIPDKRGADRFIGAARAILNSP